VQSGESPLVVQFTDLTIVTDGYPRVWLWDFGDGNVSELQHPTHTYESDTVEIFTVSLAVLATEGEFDALVSSTSTGPTNFISNEKVFGVGFTNNEAWAARASQGDTGDHFFSHIVSFNGGQYFYNTNDAIIYLKSNSSSLAFVQIRSRIVADIQDIQGQMEIGGAVDTPELVNTWTVVGRLIGVTTSNPQSTLARIVPQDQLGSPTPGSTWGIKAEAGTRTYSNTGTQSYGESASGFIQIGISNIDFVGTPLSGTSALDVQFTDLSVVAHAYSTWDFGDGNIATFAGETHPLNTYTADSCSLDLL
jgi:hypothetical protein